MDSTTKWLWIDVETTGLGYEAQAPYASREDQILELAAIITDPDLNELDSFGPRTVAASDQALALMDDYVTAMHTRTGLLAKLTTETRTLADLDAELSAWLDGHGLTGKVLLAGNSVKLDFDFIRRSLPSVFSRLHYRVIDVSTFKETLREWMPDVVAELERRKEPAHEAMDDIRWSVRELAMYRDALGLNPGR